jgi:hypothetical protein
MTQGIVHVTAATSLHGYKAWRASLTPFPDGTVITWVEPYLGTSLACSVRAGNSFKIVGCRPSFIGNSTATADLVYDMVLVSKTGREYKKKMGWSVEHIARGLHEGTLMLLIKE